MASSTVAVVGPDGLDPPDQPVAVQHRHVRVDAVAGPDVDGDGQEKLCAGPIAMTWAGTTR